MSLTLLSVILFSCGIASQKKRTVVRQGYYFVIQIESVNNDTISFHTVDIYTPFKILDINLYDDKGNLIKPSDKFFKSCKRDYNRGYLKDSNKKNIGELLLLSVNPSSGIYDDGFIVFNRVENQTDLRLSKFHSFPRNCK